ncbi:LPS export ABC transporter permease LptF, partial [bacterium]|nr:LPS export ABC transporter permease LptF [candidate division CSSED10-310 bacterium]
MKIIDRYIFKELLGPFFLGLFVFTFVMLTNVLVKLMDLFITKGVDFMTTLSILGLSIPFLLVMTIPMSVLLAVLIAFSRFSSDSEITAFKASGISIHRMVPSVLVLALLTYILTSVVYIGILPVTNLKLKQLRFDVLRTRASVGIKPHVFNTEFIHLMIYVNDIIYDKGQMQGVFIADNRNDEQPSVIVAENGYEISDPEKKRVTLRLKDGCTHEIVKGRQNRYSMTPFKTMDLNLDMLILDNAAVTKSDREMTIKELLETARSNEKKGKDSNRQWVEIWKKTALPFACFVFAILALPLGITTRRGGKSAAFATAIGLILLYYILLTGGTGLAEKGKIYPFWGAWLPNIALGLLAVYLYMRHAKESPETFIKRKISLLLLTVYESIVTNKEKRQTERKKRIDALRHIQLGRILDRYIGKQFLVIFAYVLSALVTISLIVHTFEKIDNLIEYNASIFDSLIAIGFKMPYFGYLAIHFASLVATILTIGSFNRTSELIAMKASG